MAVISPNITSGPYTASGTQATFPFDFTALSPSEVAIDVNGVTISPTLYTVAIVDIGGTVTFLATPVAGSIILLRSSPDYLQASSFENEGAYKLSTVNNINQRAAVRSLVNAKGIASVATQVADLDSKVSGLIEAGPGSAPGGIYDAGLWDASDDIIDGGVWG